MSCYVCRGDPDTAQLTLVLRRGGAQTVAQRASHKTSPGLPADGRWGGSQCVSPEGTSPAHTLIRAAGASATVVPVGRLCRSHRKHPGRLLPGTPQLFRKRPCHHSPGSSAAITVPPWCHQFGDIAGTLARCLRFQTWVSSGHLLPPSHTPLFRPHLNRISNQSVRPSAQLGNRVSADCRGCWRRLRPTRERPRSKTPLPAPPPS